MLCIFTNWALCSKMSSLIVLLYKCLSNHLVLVPRTAFGTQCPTWHLRSFEYPLVVYTLPWCKTFFLTFHTLFMNDTQTPSHAHTHQIYVRARVCAHLNIDMYIRVYKKEKVECLDKKNNRWTISPFNKKVTRMRTRSDQIANIENRTNTCF